MKRLFKLPVTRDRVRSDAGDEIDFHIEGRMDELVASGMSREEAEHEVRRRFGDRTRVEAELERIDLTTIDRRYARERVAALWRDIRYAARGLARKPLHTCAAVLTLALAIGANTAIFSVFDAVLLHPFALPDIGKLAIVVADYPQMNFRNAGLSALESIELFDRKDLFSTAAATTPDPTIVDVQGTPVRMQGTATIGDFWALTGARPLYGRFYRPEDSKYGSPSVVVLSYRMWQQISGDSTIIGRTVTLADKPYQVIGILRPEFSYPRGTAYWRPAVLDSTTLDSRNRAVRTYRFIARRHANMSLDRLDAGVRAVAGNWAQTYGGTYARGGYTMLGQSFVESQAGDLRPIVGALLGAVVFVLLIACANVASLQLVRTSGRAREFAVRAALGAGHGAIARQVVTESVILAIAGGALGIVLGKGGLMLLAQANLAQFPALRTLSINGYVLAFTAGAIVLAALVFGVAPTLRAARTDVHDALRDAARGSSGGISRHRFLRASVIVQNALVLVLLIGAGLTVRSLNRLLSVDLGFTPDGVVTFGIPLPASRYNGDAKLAFYRSLNERLRALPGVQSVGFASGVPFTSSGGSSPYSLESIPIQVGEPERHANQAIVYGDYFRTMGIRVIRGRDYTEADQMSGPPLRIIDEALVRQSFRARDPVGATISHGPGPAQIIGVVQSVKSFGLDEAAHPVVYHDFGHRAGGVGSLSVVLRSSRTPAEITRATRAIVAELDPRLPVDAARALSDRIADSVGPKQLARNVLAGFAAMALVLALLGLYAVMSYVVNQRTREIGIRLALGAQASQVAGMVMRDGAILAAFGLALGAIAYVSLGRVARSMVYGVGVFDSTTILAAVALLGVVTITACWIPARRAVRVDPVVTLRTD